MCCVQIGRKQLNVYVLCFLAAKSHFNFVVKNFEYTVIKFIYK